MHLSISFVLLLLLSAFGNFGTEYALDILCTLAKTLALSLTAFSRILNKKNTGKISIFKKWRLCISLTHLTRIHTNREYIIVTRVFAHYNIISSRRKKSTSGKRYMISHTYITNSFRLSATQKRKRERKDCRTSTCCSHHIMSNKPVSHHPSALTAPIHSALTIWHLATKYTERIE